MISPDGRFYQGYDNYYHFSEPIIENGAIHAFQQIKFSQRKYLEREGDFYKL